MRIRRPSGGPPDRVPPPSDIAAAEDARRYTDRAAAEIEAAAGADWHEPGGPADRAALTLCRLRRARAGELGGTRHGDEAVRDALGSSDPAALVWLASRAISYMEESGFPETVEPWLD